MKHPMRGTCVPGCEMYGACHCGCGGRPGVASCSRRRESAVGGRPRLFLAGHNRRVGPGYACSKTGVPLAHVLPDLRALVAIRFGVKGAAAASGLSPTGLGKMLRGEVRRVRFGNAVKISRALRDRGLANEWAEAERRRHQAELKARSRRLRRMGLRSDNRYRRPPQQVTDHQCAYCERYFDSGHALYLHSSRVHDDRTQGEHVWHQKRSQKATA